MENLKELEEFIKTLSSSELDTLREKNICSRRNNLEQKSMWEKYNHIVILLEKEIDLRVKTTSAEEWKSLMYGNI